MNENEELMLQQLLEKDYDDDIPTPLVIDFDSQTQDTDQQATAEHEIEHKDSLCDGTDTTLKVK